MQFNVIFILTVNVSDFNLLWITNAKTVSDKIIKKSKHELNDSQQSTMQIEIKIIYDKIA